MTVGARLLVVDDEEAMRMLLSRILSGAGYSVTTASHVEEARSRLLQEDFDLVLTDMQMPGGSGLDLLKHVHKELVGIATLMVTGADDSELGDEALALGAYGYIIKPFRKTEVLIGVNNALRRRDLEIENRSHRGRLEEDVKKRTSHLWDAIVEVELAEKNIRASRTETIARLALAGEFRDGETGSHVARMSRYCETLARSCASEDLSNSIREASSLHDLGKIGIPDRILLKPGPLDAEERRVMEGHAEIGHRILSDSESPLLELAAEIALTHHERFDGTGYPNGLKGDSIPLPGRLAAIADVFDALTSNRVYRRSFEFTDAIAMMKKEAGKHFDPDLLASFWDVLPEILEIGELGSRIAAQKGRMVPVA